MLEWKRVKKEIEEDIKKIYGCCDGIRKLLARHGCDSVIYNAAIYNLYNDICSDNPDGNEDDDQNSNHNVNVSNDHANDMLNKTVGIKYIIIIQWRSIREILLY